MILLLLGAPPPPTELSGGNAFLLLLRGAGTSPAPSVAEGGAPSTSSRGWAFVLTTLNGVSLGEIRNASQRNINLPLNRLQTCSFQIAAASGGALSSNSDEGSEMKYVIAAITNRHAISTSYGCS